MIFNFLGLVTLKPFDLTTYSRVSYCATYLERGTALSTYLERGTALPTYLERGTALPTYLERGTALPTYLETGTALPTYLERGTAIPTYLEIGTALPTYLERGTAFLAVEGGTTLWDRFIVHQKARMLQKKFFYDLSLKLHGLMWVMLAEHLLPTREVKSSNLFNAKK